MAKLSTRNKRALILLGIFLAAYLIVFEMVLPLYDLQSTLASDIEQQRELLERYLRVLQEKPFYEQELESLDQIIATHERALFPPGDPIRARQEVEQIARQLAEQNGVKVSRSNPIAEKNVGDEFAKVTVQLTLECEMPELVGFLHAISAHPKFLLAEEFTLTSFRVTRNRSLSRIQPRLQISGFIRLS